MAKNRKGAAAAAVGSPTAAVAVDVSADVAAAPVVAPVAESAPEQGQPDASPEPEVQADQAADEGGAGSEPAPEVEFPVTLQVMNNTCMPISFHPAGLQVAPFGCSGVGTFANPRVLNAFYVQLDQLAEIHKWREGDIVVTRKE